jgi:hypothetical protein
VISFLEDSALSTIPSTYRHLPIHEHGQVKVTERGDVLAQANQHYSHPRISLDYRRKNRHALHGFAGAATIP